MKLDDAKKSIQAVLFASGDPVEGAKLAEALDIDEKTLKSIINNIKDDYSNYGIPFEIINVGNAYQMTTMPVHADIIKQVLSVGRTAPLSPASLEVLAIIAYNQPVTRSFIEQVRGVDCSGIVRSLCDKKLVEEAGRLNIPGKPISYKTTDNFLRCFGMEKLENLPVVTEEEPEEEQLEGQTSLLSSY